MEEDSGGRMKKKKGQFLFFNTDSLTASDATVLRKIHESHIKKT